MRITVPAIVFILSCLSVLPAQAQTPMTRATANVYYNTCMAHHDDRMTNPDSQQALCSCASVKMMSTMTLEDLAGMSAKPGPGRAAYEKMLSEVYAPCLQIPLEDELEAECMRDRKINDFMLRDKDKLCRCIKQETGPFIARAMPTLMQEMLKNRPGITDIYPVLLDNPQIRGAAYKNMTTCLHRID